MGSDAVKESKETSTNNDCDYKEMINKKYKCQVCKIEKNNLRNYYRHLVQHTKEELSLALVINKCGPNFEKYYHKHPEILLGNVNNVTNNNKPYDVLVDKLKEKKIKIEKDLKNEEEKLGKIKKCLRNVDEEIKRENLKRKANLCDLKAALEVFKTPELAEYLKDEI